ncbi:hypothetical protein Pfo_020358 [Paulownia fortunei]|nr:hypothetical protein Pfo_020358 [Paulownia fortunei]
MKSVSINVSQLTPNAMLYFEGFLYRLGELELSVSLDAFHTLFTLRRVPHESFSISTHVRVAEVGHRGGRSRSFPPSWGGGLKSTSRVSDVVLGISALETSTEPAPKRARDFGTTSTPRGVEKGFFTCGLNQSKGVESYWDTQDTGIGWRKTRSIVNDFNIGRFSGKPSRSISEALADDLAEFVFYFENTENAEKKVREEVAKLSDEVAKLNDEVTKLKGELKNSVEEQQKMNENYKTIRDKYIREQTGGKKYLSSEGGKRLLESVVEKAVGAHQASPAFDEVVVQRVMVLYNDIVRDCRRMLRETGRVPEDVVMVLNPRVPELDDTLGDVVSSGNEVIGALDISDVIVELVEADDPLAASAP